MTPENEQAVDMAMTEIARKFAGAIIVQAIRDFRNPKKARMLRKIQRIWCEHQGPVFSFCSVALDIPNHILAERLISAFDRIEAEERIST